MDTSRLPYMPNHMQYAPIYANKASLKTYEVKIAARPGEPASFVLLYKDNMLNTFRCVIRYQKVKVLCLSASSASLQTNWHFADRT